MLLGECRSLTWVACRALFCPIKDNMYSVAGNVLGYDRDTAIPTRRAMAPLPFGSVQQTLLAIGIFTGKVGLSLEVWRCETVTIPLVKFNPSNVQDSTANMAQI